MNHIYRVIWNDSLGIWQAVQECARGRGKTKSKRLLALALAIGAPLALHCAHAADLPMGGSIIAGSGSIQQSGSNLTVNQGSGKLAIDWQNFSIGEGNSVTFNQPSASAVALNRVLGPDVSVIQGALHANGQVFLFNPNGVLFTTSAQVNVGALVASTLNLSTEDFLAGDYRFSGDSTNAVVNRGNIVAANGGTVALIAARVENTGNITAPQGNVLLGAGSTVTLDLGGPVKLQVDESAIDALIENGGAIRADGGTILLTARAAEDMASTVINNTGVIEARSLATGEDGSIVLLGEQGTVEVAGTIDVSSDTGRGGKAVVTGDRVSIADGAHIDATGARGGGEIYVGGGWQGKDPEIRRSATTVMDAGATLDASATGTGDGGTVVVWADGDTRFAGAIRARGADGDRGGKVEVSGKEILNFKGNVDTGGGTLLLDPANITVQSADGDADNTFSGAQIKALLAGNDVTLTADNAITWNPDATLDYDGIGTGRTLTLTAGTSITVAGTISDAVQGGDALSVALNAGGDVTVNGTLHSGDGGNIDINSGGQGRTGGVIEAGGAGNLNFYASAGLELNSGKMRVANGNLQANVNNNINPIWGGGFEATGTGNIELISRASGIYLGGSGSSAGHATTQSGNITLTANTIEIRPNDSTVSGGGALLLQPYTATATVGIGTGAIGTLALNANTITRIADGFSSVTIGRADGSGAVDIRSAAFKDNVVIRAPSGNGSITVNGVLSTTGDSITLEAANGIAQAVAGGVQATNLLLLGGGTFNLTAGTNNVGTLAANLAGPLSFHDANALTVGSVGGRNGITATGTIAVATNSGNLTVDQAVTTTDTTAGAIVLNAGRNTAAGTSTGGDIILNAALATGDDGRVTLQTGSIANSTGVATAAGGSGSGRYRYGSDETTTAYTAALGSGTYVIYRERPTLTVTPGTASGQYGDAPDLSGVSYTVSGYQNGDTGGLSGTATYTTTATATSNVGSYDIAYSSGLTQALGYALANNTGATGEYSVTQRVLNLSGTRAYDGTTNLANTIFTLGNLANGDTLNLTGIGTMADKHAGDDKAVSLGTLALANGADGDLASNYTLATGTHEADISKAALTVSTGNVTKTYDGTTTAAGTAAATAGTLFGTDSLSGGQFAFSNADAGTGKTVTVANVTVNDGNGGNNYNVTHADNTTSTITQKALTLGGSFTASHKVYDGNATATIADASSLTLTGLVGTESLGLTGLAAAFSDKNAATGKTVNLTAAGLADGSGKASNYSLGLADAPATTANITPKTLTLGGTFTAGDKVYDGSTVATLDTSGLSLTGLVAGEDLSLAGLAGSFADKNAGTGIAVSINAASLADGANGSASNYALDMSNVPGTTANIARKTLTVGGAFTASSKVYDGNTVAMIDTSGLSLAGLVTGEDLNLTGLAGSFADKDAGLDIAVSLNGATLADGANGSAANYTLDMSNAPAATADIARKALALGGTFTVDNKVYDGNATATIADASNLTLTGLVGTESLGLTGLAAAFSDKNAATGKTVNLTAAGLANGSGKASNYSLDLAGAPATTANITPKTLTLGGTFTAGDKVYDGSTVATLDTSGLSLTGLVAGEDLSLAGLAGSFADKNAGTGIAVSINAASLADGANGSASNYALDMSNVPGTTADITRRPVSVRADNKSTLLGMPDPALTYAAESQSAGRGLVNGEMLGGTPVRESGVAIGNYVIGQGSLTDANNPNYAISFMDGLFSIEPSPEVTTAQHVSQVLPLALASNLATAPQGAAWNVDVQPDLNSSQAPASSNLQFVAAPSGGGAEGGTEGNNKQSESQPGIAAPAGPLTVFVVEGGIRLPDLDGLQKELP